MTPRDALAGQMTSLRGEVHRERATLETRFQAITGGAPNRIVAAEIMSQLHNRLNAGADQLTAALVSLQNGGNVATGRRKYRKVEADCRDLFGECLTVLTAEAIRALQLDGGVSAIVERLLVEVSQAVSVPWSHLTALAEAEFFATASQIIRIRYPVSSIWDIPIAVHEFGHFIGPKWPSNIAGGETPYQVFLSVKNLGSKSHLGEYFADMFATFIMGPSYVASCLERRFDPAPDTDVSGTHPNDLERAEWILICLELLLEGVQQEMPGSNTDLFLQEISSRKRADWKAAVTESDGQEVKGEVVENLNIRARELWRSLMAWAGTAACRDLKSALLLRAAFVNKGVEAKPVMGAKIRDIVNAAWILRMESESDAERVARIEQWARTLLTRAEL